MTERKLGITTETSEETQGSKFIPINSEEDSIQENRYLKELEVGENDQDGQAVSYFQVVVRDSEDRTANKRYFEPRIDGRFINTEEDLAKADQKLLKVLANLIRRFKGDQAETPQVSNWKDMFTQTKRIIEETSGWEKVNLRVKVILNKDDFPTLPGYAPIFENATTPKSESKLKVMPEYNDRVVKNNDTSSPDSDLAAAPAGGIDVDF